MEITLRDVLGLAAAVNAAQAGGLMAALVERSGSAADLARRCSLDERACKHVLDVLSVFGVVARQGDSYGAEPTLREEAARPGMLTRLDADIWAHAPNFLRTGAPFVVMDGPFTEREVRYKDVVGELAKIFAEAADQLAVRCDLAPRSILEVGCGSGVWSLALARRLPEARVTGLDSPAVLEQFRTRAASLGLGERIATIAGDMHTVALPGKQWDLAVIANVLRLEQPPAARALIERIVAAVRPGGSILVVDALATGTPAVERARALYALHLALRTRSGRVHAPAEIAAWLQEAGCDAPTEIRFDERFREFGALGALVARRR